MFVVGNSRSGTTMLARMLGLHPAVHTLPELHFFEELWTPEDEHRALAREPAVELAEQLLHRARGSYHRPLTPGQHRSAAAGLVDALPAGPLGSEVLRAVLDGEAGRHGASVACEQTPRTVFYVEELLRLLPAAYVVVLVRDPRDVLLSQKNWWRRRFRGTGDIPLRTTVRRWVDYHPLTTSLLWRGGVRAGDRHPESPRVTHLRYEDLVADPENALRQVLAPLGLAFDPALLAVRRISSSNEVDREGTGVDASRSGHWRTGLRPAELWLSQRITGVGMARHGYAPVPVAAGPGLLWAALTWPLKTVLAVLLNTGRTRSLALSVRRRVLPQRAGAT